MDRVAIFDLGLTDLIFHSTPMPSTSAMLISGYEKESGNSVVLAEEPPNPALYDRVYVVKDKKGLTHDPSWLNWGIAVGKHWEIDTEWNPEWEEALPDVGLYKSWVERWQEKYQTFPVKRLSYFFRKPFKIKQNNKFKFNDESELLIIDNDIEEWDREYEMLSQFHGKNHILLHPLQLDNNLENALDLFDLRHINREFFWSTFNLDNNSEDMSNEAKIIAERKPGRMFRIRLYAEAHSHQEWEEKIIKSYKIMEQFRVIAGKRISFYPFNIHAYNYPRILQEMKRWSGKDMGYKKNSLIEYIIYDGCRDIQKMAEFLHSPYEYVSGKRKGQNKLVDLVPFIEENPELTSLLFTSYQHAAL